jgi:hypothetical protein
VAIRWASLSRTPAGTPVSSVSIRGTAFFFSGFFNPDFDLPR